MAVQEFGVSALRAHAAVLVHTSTRADVALPEVSEKHQVGERHLSRGGVAPRHAFGMCIWCLFF